MSDTITLSNEELAQLEPHSKRWMDIAMRTAPQTEAEKAKLTEEMIKFYKVMNLPELKPEWVIHVKSGAMEGRFVAGLLAAGWHMHLEVDPKAWPMERLLKLREFCLNLPRKSKRDLTRWYTHPYDVNKIRELSGLGEWGLDCVRVAHRMWHGGNMACSSETFISFLKEVVGAEKRFNVDFTTWDPWEETIKLGGGRFLHRHFAVVSDFPEILTYDDQDRPHGENAPHVRWRDGSAIYSAHGVDIPAWIIETPEKLTAKKILSERNAEVRRVMMEKMTPARFITEANAQIVHEDKDGLGKSRRLLRVEIPGDEPLVMVEVTNSTAEPDGTFRVYHLRVDPNAYNGRAGRECLAAIASTWRKKKPGTPLMFSTPEEYVLAIET